MNYNDLGNIIEKGDVGVYSYFAGGDVPSAVRPHAVRSIASFAGMDVNGLDNPIYRYDRNGNMTSGGGRDIQWTSFNKAALITMGTHQVSFDYGPGHSRFRQTSGTGASAEETLYLGDTERREVNGAVTWVDYVMADGRRVAQRTKTAVTETWNYFIHDHLGSTTVMLDTAGAVPDGGRYSFDPWGKRRNPADGSEDAVGQFYAASFWPTTRGFTGHEQVPDVGLINMNARLYDAEIGRFISPDSVTESLVFSQVFNRYTYVGNNPLSHVDPTGHSWLSKLFKKVPILRAIFQITIAIVASVVLAGSGIAWLAAESLGNAIAAGFIAGGISGGSLKSALIGGLQAGLFHGAGTFAQGFFDAGKVVAGTAAKFVSHGLVGGLTSELQGGTFGSGFLAAGVSSLAGPFLKKGKVVRNTVISAVAGGVGSELGGGKFANGAVTGAYGYLFNEWKHGKKNYNKPGHNSQYAEPDSIKPWSILKWARALTSPVGAFLAVMWPTPLGNGEVIVTNPVPDTLARIYPGSQPYETLGRPNEADVFVTAYEDIAGLSAAELAEALTIAPAESFVVVSFPTPASGVSTPIGRSNPGFIGGGTTAGGAREFTIPNGKTPPNAKIEIVK